MIKIYYYAVDKDGQGWYYDSPPVWNGESWNIGPGDCIYGFYPEYRFDFPAPEGVTYKDEPIKIEIEI